MSILGGSNSEGGILSNKEDMTNAGSNRGVVVDERRYVNGPSRSVPLDEVV